MIAGTGTLANVATVLVGSGLGIAIGHRLPARTRDLVTDALGLVTLLIAALSAIAVTSADLAGAVGDNAPLLIVLGALLIGGITGSLLRLEDRVEGLGRWWQARLVTDGSGAARQRFVEGFVVSSLVFCTGPLTILGSLNDGLGNGADQLYLKSALDGFAAIAFAASFGFMLPVSTPQNAVVYGSGVVPITKMIRSGVTFDVLGAVLILILLPLMVSVLGLGG